jgi:predicted extracellular nuclease
MAAVINEFVFNHTGTDTNEYIEVFASAGDVPSAGGYTLLVLEGDGTAAGVIDNVIAVGAPDASGFSTTPFLANAIENGTLTVLLVAGFGGATGNDLDTNNDGVLDATPWTTLVDSVAVSDGGADDRAYSATVLTSANIGAGFTPGGASRVPNGTDTDSAADWRLNDFDLAGIPGFTGTLVPPEVANTPNASNGGAAVAPGILVSPTSTDVAEGGATDSFTVVLNTQPTADVVILLAGDADATVDAETLTFTAANWNVAQTVTVTAVDDTLVQGTHAATITTAAATSSDASYNGLNAADVAVAITDNDVSTSITSIAAIQGASHTSPKLGLSVITTGIVVARDLSGTAGNGQRGFYIMDPTGDGDDATSEGLFVAVPGTGVLPQVGEALTVTGTVNEFLPGGAATNLSITRLERASWTVDSTANALPGVTIGAGGRLPPTSVAQDDDFTSFDITTDGVDFYESLEGMRVSVTNTKVTGPTNGFGETWVYSQDQVDAGPTTARGGLLLSEFDINPERIQVQTDTGVTPGISLSADVADTLGQVTGVLRYDFQNFELVLTAQPSVTDGGVTRETTTLAGGADTLLIAAYNAENLDFLDPDARFTGLADTIINALNRPDILGLEEIQDNDGATDSGNPDATQTLERLVQAIADAGGPAYEFININPENNQDGGQPGGNIRTVFLYNPDRVDYVPGSAFRITDPAAPGGGQDGAFESSRKPLVAEFIFQGQEVTVVNNHWTSKGGSTGPFSADFPPVNLGEDQRLAQAVLVKDFVEAELASNASARVAVIGDLNEFEWNAPLQELTGGPTQILFNLRDELLPANERYGYNFEGQAQSLDHIFVTQSLLPGAAVDVVHINSEFAVQQSDHDPNAASFRFAGTIQLEFWGANVFPGAAPTRAPDFHWRDQASDLHYTAANTSGVQRASLMTDSATGASDDLFSSLDGDIAISQLDFAAGPRGSAGGPALVTLDWLSDSAALVRSNAAWGSLKGLRIDSFSGDALRLEGFVDLHLALAEATRDLTVVADGPRRGTIETGGGDDSITVGFDSVDTTWGNTVVVRAGAGDDVITVGLSVRNYIVGLWDLAGSSSIVTGGAGNDTLVGAASRDTAVFTGNAADYTIAVNAGVTTVIGADGADTIQNFEFLRFADTTLAFSGGIWG